MAKLTINLGAAPTGQGGDTPRSANVKIDANFDELYDALGAGGWPKVLPAALPVVKGGTGGTTQASARTALGLGTAATATQGTAAGNLMPMQSESWYAPVSMDVPVVGELYNMNRRTIEVGKYVLVGGSRTPGAQSDYGLALGLKCSGNEWRHILQFSTEGDVYDLSITNPAQGGKWKIAKFYTTLNTTRAADGTLKAI